jgi:hypothetical protein
MVLISNMFNLESIFKVLKYVLIVSNVLIIIGSIFLMLSGRDLGEPEFKHNHSVLIFACFMVILFCTIGILGAWKHNFALTITYATLMTVALILEVAELSSEDVISFCLSIFIVICAFSYAALIKRMQNLEIIRRSFSHETAKI